MISLDALIDTFNSNTGIKTTELANWKRDAAAARHCIDSFSPPSSKPFGELSFHLHSNRQAHFYVHCGGRRVAPLDIEAGRTEVILTHYKIHPS